MDPLEAYITINQAVIVYLDDNVFETQVELGLIFE